VGETGLRGSCVLLGNQLCGWLPHVEYLGLKVVGILLKSNKLMDLLESKYGDLCDVQVGDWTAAKIKADVVLVDGVANYEVLEVASKCEAKLVCSTMRTRAKASKTKHGWRIVARERIAHQQVGGITEKSGISPSISQ
jgi:hypothetical protein